MAPHVWRMRVNVPTAGEAAAVSYRAMAGCKCPRAASSAWVSPARIRASRMRFGTSIIPNEYTCTSILSQDPNGGWLEPLFRVVFANTPIETTLPKVVAPALSTITLILLLVSGASKILDPNPTTGAMRATRLPASLSISRVLGVSEMVAGTLGLVLGGYRSFPPPSSTWVS